MGVRKTLSASERGAGTQREGGREKKRVSERECVCLGERVSERERE